MVSCVDLIGWGDWMDWEEGCFIDGWMDGLDWMGGVLSLGSVGSAINSLNWVYKELSGCLSE